MSKGDNRRTILLVAACIVNDILLEESISKMTLKLGSVKWMIFLSCTCTRWESFAPSPWLNAVPTTTRTSSSTKITEVDIKSA